MKGISPPDYMRNYAFLPLLISGLLTAAFVMLSVQETHAQITGEQRSGSIRVVGTVVPSLGGENVIFDIIYEPQFDNSFERETLITLDPVTDLATGETGAGYFVAKGLPGAVFQLNFPREITLRHVETGTKVTVKYLLSSNEVDEQESSSYVLRVSPRFRLNSEGEHHFWIGGQVDVTDAPEGEYAGDFTLEVEYL